MGGSKHAIAPSVGMIYNTEAPPRHLREAENGRRRKRRKAKEVCSRGPARKFNKETKVRNVIEQLKRRNKEREPVARCEKEESEGEVQCRHQREISLSLVWTVAEFKSCWLKLIV